MIGWKKQRFLSVYFSLILRQVSGKWIWDPTCPIGQVCLKVSVKPWTQCQRWRKPPWLCSTTAIQQMTHHHDNCPVGTDSWCFYQKSIALGHPVGSHADNINTPLSELVVSYISPIFEEKSLDELLSRCTLQATQNASKSLHSVIWARCPKHKFVNLSSLSIAVALGCTEFNFG